MNMKENACMDNKPKKGGEEDMTLYVMEVEQTPGPQVQVGDRVVKGQTIGLARDLQTAVISPDDGIVRRIEFNPVENSITVNVLSTTREFGPCSS
jgi:Na+-translocating ferredoxin:NAD+ oxidoreductase RnfC subunit